MIKLTKTVTNYNNISVNEEVVPNPNTTLDAHDTNRVIETYIIERFNYWETIVGSRRASEYAEEEAKKLMRNPYTEQQLQLKNARSFTKGCKLDEIQRIKFFERGNPLPEVYEVERFI